MGQRERPTGTLGTSWLQTTGSWSVFKQVGAFEGEIVLNYLDQSGISLCLPPAYSWTKKGRANRREVRTRWGKQGST